jgi:hypothetical protein
MELFCTTVSARATNIIFSKGWYNKEAKTAQIRSRIKISYEIFTDLAISLAWLA